MSKLIGDRKSCRRPAKCIFSSPREKSKGAVIDMKGFFDLQACDGVRKPARNTLFLSLMLGFALRNVYLGKVYARPMTTFGNPDVHLLRRSRRAKGCRVNTSKRRCGGCRSRLHPHYPLAPVDNMRREAEAVGAGRPVVTQFPPKADRCG